ncbi:hypothetical protein DVK05_11160 [Halorubrum sp. Atlit-8R]|uniref:DUF7532 family protein n=1 Tax=unclassified Halorubrum TaxID=2642239 RepID=UPI000EF1C499|nr:MULTISPECIES: hypothetical protein [unclassified Halorubrum]RLM67284.1 hypothetical protein DVK08_11225 [Halorubrum sp. Atlit-9R]RLM77444.1 hypothetical protein DVK05_11160 [Halorubrum sp. Atlit-8R]
MHFDPRVQRALREAGLDADAVANASDRVAELVARDADRLRSFFGAGGPYYSDMEMAHSADAIQEHPTAEVDLFTHGSDLRGYLSLDGWGVPVEDGRVLREDDGGAPVVVELSLGDTVNDRVRFARERGEL